MGRKKPFIKKGEGVKFYLVHRSQKDPLYLANELGEHVLMPADEEQAAKSNLVDCFATAHKSHKGEDPQSRDKRLNEQQKYGIYYEDDYDYLQHLKEVNLNDADEDNDADKLVKVGSVMIKSDAFNEQTKQQQQPKASKLLLPSTVFASNFEEDVGYFNQAAPDHDPKINWDPDIVRLLDEDAKIDAGENSDFEDDFFIRANQDLPNKPKNKLDENDDDQDHSSNFDDHDDEGEYDDDDESESKSMRDFDRKSRFSQYSMTSSVIRRNESLKMLDKQFERLFEEYDDDQIGPLDTEEIEGFRVRDEVLNAALEEFDKIMDKKAPTNQRVPKSKKLPILREQNESGEDFEQELNSSSSDDSDEDESETEVLRYDRKREKEDRLDCESIISTYSNIYNHPAIINDENKASKIEISKKSGLPLGVLNEKEKSKKELERIDHKIVRVLPELPLKRDPNESKQEKKDRKQAIKSHRRERRVEKKINKMAFKEEKKSQEGQIRNTVMNKNIVKLPL